MASTMKEFLDRALNEDEAMNEKDLGRLVNQSYNFKQSMQRFYVRHEYGKEPFLEISTGKGTGVIITADDIKLMDSKLKEIKKYAK